MKNKILQNCLNRKYVDTLGEFSRTWVVFGRKGLSELSAQTGAMLLVFRNLRTCEQETDLGMR